MDVVRAQGIEQWAQLCSESFVPLRTASDVAFHGTIAHLDLDGVGVSHVFATRSRVFRPAKLISSEPRDDVLMSLHLTGTGWVEQGDRHAHLLPGTAAIYEADRPYTLRFDEPMSELVLQVPRRRLRMRDEAIRATSAHLVQRTTPSLEVLRHLLVGIVRGGDLPGLNDRLAETTVDLLTAIMRPLSGGGDPDHRDVSREAIVHSAKTLMKRHLDDPSVNVEYVARRLRVSRRYLELLFVQEQRSPGEYLRHLRLERARGLLADPRTSVTEVAFAAGFQDISTFGRAFKRDYGVTPRDYRRGNS